MILFLGLFLSIHTAVSFAEGKQLQTPTVVSSKVVSAKEEQYLACGCGCCPSSLEKPIVKCLDTKIGESLSSVKQKDIALKKSKSCETAGCSQAILYKDCR